MKLLFLLLIISCSTKEQIVPRTIYSDPVMRVMIDPESIDEGNYAAVVHSLVTSGKWTVIDRGSGFKALRKEQENLHKNEPDRYPNIEKYAHWGRLYGVGGVMVANIKCSRFFDGGEYWDKCTENLSLVNANTGVIIVSSNLTVDTIDGGISNWDTIVNDLNFRFPKDFKEDPAIHERLKQYRKETKEHGEAMEMKARRERIRNGTATEEDRRIMNEAAEKEFKELEKQVEKEAAEGL